MIITQNNHKRVLYKHCLKARIAHGYVILSKNNASQMRCSCLALLNFHTTSSDTLKTKTVSSLWLNQDRRFLLPTKVYDHRYMQKLHLTQKSKFAVTLFFLMRAEYLTLTKGIRTKGMCWTFSVTGPGMSLLPHFAIYLLVGHSLFLLYPKDRPLWPKLGGEHTSILKERYIKLLLS